MSNPTTGIVSFQDDSDSVAPPSCDGDDGCGVVVLCCCEVASPAEMVGTLGAVGVTAPARVPVPLLGAWRGGGRIRLEGRLWATEHGLIRGTRFDLDLLVARIFDATSAHQGKGGAEVSVVSV